MSIGGLVLLVGFRARAGQERAFAKQLLGIVPLARASSGNRQYEFYSDPSDPANFMLYEEWADAAVLARHRDRPEIAALVPDTKSTLERDPEMSTWTQAYTNADGEVGKTTPPVGHVTLVRFRLKPEAIEKMLAEIRSDAARMSGNIRFDLNRAPQAPTQCMICARWESRAVWEAHNAAPEFRHFIERTKPFLATPMQRSLWRPAA